MTNLADNIGKELRKPMDASLVKPPPAGKFGEYIAAYDVIKLMNFIFGWDGWSHRVDTLTRTNEGHGKKEDTFAIGYAALVTVDLHPGGLQNGITASHQCIGHGQGHGKSIGDCYDSAMKEAATDALKRAVRVLGDPMGLALYDKAKANVAERADPERVKSAVKYLLEASSMDALQDAWKDVCKAGLGVEEEVVAAKEEAKVNLEEAAAIAEQDDDASKPPF
jgi:DNA repair and recombination protein RAD52